MAAGVRQLEATVAEQAASTSQVSATSKEIYATVQQLARIMKSVTSMASDAAQSAGRGVTSLEGIHRAIENLLAASAQLGRTLEAISDKSRDIDEVIGAMTQIANRTNLLSLNAAIEAEKAGEKAGGFAVVAVEIRRLADETAVAALNIERLITEMQAAVRTGVAGVASYAEQTRSSSAAIDELSSSLGTVIDTTQKLGPEFETVNQGMQMQSEGAGQIAASIEQLRESASQTKDSLGEFRKLAEDLRAAVTELQTEVGRFSTAG
jgi:methyl-accepting chemotaxis protein WspA